MNILGQSKMDFYYKKPRNIQKRMEIFVVSCILVHILRQFAQKERELFGKIGEIRKIVFNLSKPLAC